MDEWRRVRNIEKMKNVLGGVMQKPLKSWETTKLVAKTMQKPTLSQPLILLTLSSSPEVEEYQVFGFWIPLPSISASKSFSQNAPLGANWCQACSSQKGVPWAIRIMCCGVTSFVVKKSCIVAVVVAQVLIPTLMIQKVWILSKPTCISHEDRSRYGCTGNNQTWADRLT